jgi:large subunit ribosomal protein L4
MATFDVINLEKQKVGTIDLADAIVNASLDNSEALFYEVVKAQLASRRAGTVGVKNRSLVSGGGKKPYKQKGTGRARQGSIRASQWVGGGKAMAPKMRDHEYHVPKKVRKAAIRAAISKRNADKALVIVDAWAPGKPSTKEAMATFAKLGLENALVLGMKGANETLFKSVRNAKKYKFLPVEGANVYDILKHHALVLTRDSAKALEGVLA